MTASFNLGSLEIDEDSNGNLVFRDENGTTVATYDITNDEWEYPNLTATDATVTNLTATDATVTNLTATDATVSNPPTDANDVAIKEYVDSVAQGLDWQDSVIDEQNDPPSSPTDGDRYLIDDNPTGDWSGQPNDIVEWDGSQWVFFDPNEGWAVFLEDVDLLKVYDSNNWVAFGSAIDHGALAGLGDDDHTQYLLVDGTRALTGNLDVGDNAIQNAGSIDNEDYNEAVDTRSGVSGTQTVDLSVSNWYEIEADGDITISFSNVTSTPPGNSLVIYLEDSDGTGPHTVSWPSSVTWSGGTVEDTIPSNDDLEITLLSPDGGSSWRARKSGESFS